MRSPGDRTGADPARKRAGETDEVMKRGFPFWFPPHPGPSPFRERVLRRFTIDGFADGYYIRKALFPATKGKRIFVKFFLWMRKELVKPICVSRYQLPSPLSKTGNKSPAQKDFWVNSFSRRWESKKAGLQRNIGLNKGNTKKEGCDDHVFFH